MAKKIRNIKSRAVQDGGIIENSIYNQASGGQKNISVGPHLLPLNASATTFTTDASTARALPDTGKILYIFNNDTVIHSITLGESSAVVALAAGITDASAHVGIPCPPNAWFAIACNEKTWVIADSNKLLVYLVDDESYIRTEST
jgi:hypothetical protein